MSAGFIKLIITQKYSKPAINRVQNSTIWVIISFDMTIAWHVVGYCIG